MSNYALIKNNDIEVVNTIVADENFEIEGFQIINLSMNVYCQTGMFYNVKDGLFYDGSDFKTIAGISQ